MTARQWTVTDTGQRPLTVNAVMSMHRQRWAAHTRKARERWGWLIRDAGIPPLHAVTITATPLHRDGRSPQDVAACAPEAKAAIDALVDAGVLPDDDATRVRAVAFAPPRRSCGVDGLELVITEVVA